MPMTSPVTVPWAVLTALPRLALAAERSRRARAHRAAAPLPVGGLTDAEAREADFALLTAAQSDEARWRAPARHVWAACVFVVALGVRSRGPLRAQDAEVLALRRALLACAAEASRALCAELRRGAADEHFWRARAAGAGAAGAATHLLEQAPAVLRALLTWHSLPRPASDVQARLAALHAALHDARVALAAVHHAAQPLGGAQLLAPLPSDAGAGTALARMPAARMATATAAMRLADALSQLAAARGDVPIASLQPDGDDAPDGAAACRAAAPFTLAATRCDLRRAQRALARVTSSADANAAAGYPLGLVPCAARRPSRLRRHWPRYALMSLAAAAAARWLLARHASGDLARWASSAREAVAAAYRQHVVAPLRAVTAELFSTFHSPQAGSVSPETLEASRASLQRMLADFAARHHAVDAAAAAAAAADPAAQEAGMAVVMRTYESEVARPLRGLLAGDLAWALLIQVQKLKTDTEATMRALEQVLRANELTIALVAALPSLGLLGALAAATARLLARRPPAPGARTAALRRHFADAERALAAAAAREAAPAWRPRGAAAERDAALGAVLAALDGVHDAAAALMSPSVRASGPAAALAAELGVRPSAAATAAQWDAFQRDLMLLAAPRGVPAPRKEATAARMARTYAVLAPPALRAP
jgi:hypothetical protein